MSNKLVLVAVYGSLRPGMGNHGLNISAGSDYVGKGRTVDNCDIYEYSYGAFPSVSLEHSESGCGVVVDVFSTTEEALHRNYDRLEGTNSDDPQGSSSWYKRSKVMIKMDQGDGVELECYIYHMDEVQKVRVESGDWVDHKGCNDFYIESINKSFPYIDPLKIVA